VGSRVERSAESYNNSDVTDPARIEDEQGARYGVGPLLTLSDGVFAIALTLLVLSLSVSASRLPLPSWEPPPRRQARIAAPDESLDVMSGRIDAGQVQPLYPEAGPLALSTLVATLERDGVIVPDPRTGGPSFVRSGCLPPHGLRA
jgi:hypothetical protein